MEMDVQDPEGGKFAGSSYAAVIVQSGEAGSRERVLEVLRGIGFSGWVSPIDDGWVVAVLASPTGASAGGRRGVVEVGRALADAVPGVVLGARVLGDEQLALAMWRDGEELGRYVSDPSYGSGDREIMPDPYGVEHADVFAQARGLDDDAAERLAEILDEGLDPDSEIESERLTKVLRLLGMPTWVVSCYGLPKSLVIGPPVKQFTKLGDGRTGLGGLLAGGVKKGLRERRAPAPVLVDPPRGHAPEYDPWLF